MLQGTRFRLNRQILAVSFPKDRPPDLEYLPEGARVCVSNDKEITKLVEVQYNGVDYAIFRTDLLDRCEVVDRANGAEA